MANKIQTIKTLGQLKSENYRPKTVREEVQSNLIHKIQNSENLFEGIHGYDDTVFPQIIHALLSGHHMVFLGEKGQGKSRIMRSLTNFLDEYIPVIKGAPIPQSPFNPISIKAREILKEAGDDTPIQWMHKSERYGERLSAGLKVSDLIGDVDPSAVMTGSPLDSEGALHFGIIPRTNLGIFAVNELPDLDYLVQVALFNILEEGDIQIRGFPFRFPLDLFIVFSANPADYSRSGKIITQLKDRMGSEIRTHYPIDRKVGMTITAQEANFAKSPVPVDIPEFMQKVNEELTIQARSSKQINQKSGVSTRFSITNYEVLGASALKRALIKKELVAVARPSDFGNVFSSALGKIELDPYRDEAVTEYHILSRLIERAFEKVFSEYFDLESQEEKLSELTREILSAGQIEVSDTMASESYKEILKKVPSLFDFVRDLNLDEEPAKMASAIEFVLEGLVGLKKLGRRKSGGIQQFKAIDFY